jgi:hypothetical protein
METKGTAAGVIEIVALADDVDCAVLCAVTVTAVDGTDKGSV